jgi:hypothetical protein
MRRPPLRWRPLRSCWIVWVRLRRWPHCRFRHASRDWFLKRRIAERLKKGCAAAAVLSAGERGSTDLLALIEREWQPQTRRVYDQLRGLVRARSRAGSGKDTAVLQSVLAAFPDRVARHRRDGELLLSGGGSARLPDCRYDFLVAIDVEDRRDRGLPLVRLAAPIEPEWLLDRATERITLEWNRAAERVDEVTALVYDQLVIEETRRPAPESDDASRMLAEKAREAGVEKFADRGALEQLRARAAFAGSAVDPEKALESLCLGTNFILRISISRVAQCIAATEARSARARDSAIAGRPPGEGALRARQASVDRIATSGFLRCARNSTRQWNAGGGTPSRTESAAGAGDQRPRGILGTTLPASSARIVATLSEAQVAGEALVTHATTQVQSPASSLKSGKDAFRRDTFELRTQRSVEHLFVDVCNDDVERVPTHCIRAADEKRHRFLGIGIEIARDDATRTQQLRGQ